MCHRSLVVAALALACAAVTVPAYAASGDAHGILLFGSNRTGNEDVYSARPDGTRRVDLTRDSPANDFQPRLSPDGRRIVFVSERSGSRQIWLMRADGSSAHQLTTITGEHPDWAAGGTQIVFESDHGGSRDIYRMNADGSQ